jgi:hypothetical protein
MSAVQGNGRKPGGSCCSGNRVSHAVSKGGGRCGTGKRRRLGSEYFGKPCAGTGSSAAKSAVVRTFAAIFIMTPSPSSAAARMRASWAPRARSKWRRVSHSASAFGAAAFA